MVNLVFIYITLTFLVLRFSVTVFNFLSNPKLGNYSRRFSEKVSVIISVTATTIDLKPTLQTLLQQNYQQLEVFIIHSEKAIVEPEVKAICKNDDRFILREKSNFHIDETEGVYLLFLEPNVLVHDALINSLIYRVKVFKLALLNVIPSRILKGVNAHLLLPLREFVLLNLIPIRLVRLFASPVFSAAGNGCMFFDASVYRERIWQQKTDFDAQGEIDLVRAVKQEGLKVETLMGNKLISVPGNEQLSTNFLKTGQQLLKIFGDNILVASLYLLMVVGGPLIMFLNYEFSLLILPVGLIFLSRIMISFLSAQNPVWNVLLHPLQMLFLLASLCGAIFSGIIQQIKQKG